VNERANRRDVDAFVAWRSGVEAVVFQSFYGCFPVIIAHVLEGWIGVLEAGPGEVPMEIGVCEIVRILAAFALPAWRRLFVLAKDGLSKPECESLLAYPPRTVKKEARGKGARFDACGQAFPEILMSKKWGERHGVIWHVS
jgi:hypothetical protein